jgi:leucyl aminopeptidase (aminopeptidase T)
VVSDILNSAPLRVVSLTIPTPDRAAGWELPYDQYADILWAGIGADYARIAKAAEALKQRLRGAKEVRITSPAGTDLRFAIGSRPVFVDDGIVEPEAARDRLFLNRLASLPGGTVFVAPIENSANGVIVVPKTRCNFKPVEKLRFELKAGKIANLTAATGETCIKEILTAYTGPVDRLGTFTIGLNPEMRVIEDNGAYWPPDAAGLVSLGVGGNKLLGGANHVPGDGGFSVPVTGATVEIDGTPVVREGKLVGAAQTASR